MHSIRKSDDDENINIRFLKLMSQKRTFTNGLRKVDFQDIDRQLLTGFECSQYNQKNKKFLSMIKEQTNSAINNKKYWNSI